MASDCRVNAQDELRTRSESTSDCGVCKIDSLLDLFDALKRKAEKQKPSKFQEREARRSSNCARVAELAASPERALTYLNKAIDYRASPGLYTKRCVLHLHMENYLLAAADAICAIGMDPTFPSGYWCGAAASIRNEAYCDALNYLSKLRNSLPNSKHCNDLYVRSRNAFWTSDKIPALEVPDNIARNPIDEPYSVFVESKISALKSELSSSGVLEASKLNEKFVKKVIETYKRGLFHLPQKYVFILLKNSLDLLKEQPNIVSIDIGKRQKVTVVGDLQGSFVNLMSIFRHNHSPQLGRSYIFNGNVIGNDKMSLPCMVILLCMKLLFPEDVHIARGSEECIEMCDLNGFVNEVVTVYDEDTMKGFTEVFNWLPVAHVVNNSVLVVHGGLFQDENLSLADIQEMKRCHQPPDFGPMCDILQSDPWNQKGIAMKDHRRGIWFGPDITERFCHLNCIDYIITSHRSVGPSGIETQDGRRCVTLNSSTHYATYIVIKGKKATYKVVHARRDKIIPKHCRCFLVCKCSAHQDEKEQDLQPNYVTLDLTLPQVPSDLAAESSSTLQERSSAAMLELVSSAQGSSKSVQLVSRSKSTSSQIMGKLKSGSRIDEDGKEVSGKRDTSMSAVTISAQEESLRADRSISHSTYNPEASTEESSMAASIPSHQPFSPRSSSQQSTSVSIKRPSNISAKLSEPGTHNQLIIGEPAMSDVVDATAPIVGHSLERLLNLPLDGESEDAMTEATADFSIHEEHQEAKLDYPEGTISEPVVNPELKTVQSAVSQTVAVLVNETEVRATSSSVTSSSKGISGEEFMM